MLCVLVSWKAIEKRVKEYFITFLFLETAMVGTLCSLDLVLFYIFWELMLIPMYLLIGIWGGPRRIYAAIKFFLFTMAGSVLMLLAIFALYFQYYKATGVYTFNVLDLYNATVPGGLQYWLFARLRPLLRHQGAHVPGAYVAARCPYRGTDRRERDPRGGAPQDGHLRFLEVRHSLSSRKRPLTQFPLSPSSPSSASCTAPSSA